MLKRSEQKKSAPGFVHPVGGKVDLNENPYEAAVREVREEAGITVKDLNLRAVLLELKPLSGSDEKYNWVIYYFVGEYYTGDVIETEEGELTWLTIDEIKQSRLFPSVEPIIGHLLDMSKGPLFMTNEYGGHESNILRSERYECIV